MVYSLVLRNTGVHQIDYRADINQITDIQRIADINGNIGTERNSYELRSANSKPLKINEGFPAEEPKNEQSSSRNSVRLTNTVMAKSRFKISV